MISLFIAITAAAVPFVFYLFVLLLLQCCWWTKHVPWICTDGLFIWNTMWISDECSNAANKHNIHFIWVNKQNLSIPTIICAELCEGHKFFIPISKQNIQSFFRPPLPFSISHVNLHMFAWHLNMVRSFIFFSLSLCISIFTLFTMTRSHVFQSGFFFLLFHRFCSFFLCVCVGFSFPKLLSDSGR